MIQLRALVHYYATYKCVRRKIKCKLHFEIVKELEIMFIGAVIGVALHQVTATSGNTVEAFAQFPSGILRRKRIS